MAGRLERKTIIITGGNRGIGKAASELFAQEGANVIIGARNAEHGEAVAASIRESGGKALFMRSDVSNPDDCRALVEAAVSNYGRLDGAFNNAGIAQFGTPITEVSLEDWDRIMGVNLRGAFLCLKYQMAAMAKTGGGAIVIASSVGGLVALPGLSAYQSSKHGLIGLTKVAALEGAANGIRVNAICPGATRTEMFDEWMAGEPGLEEKALAALPFGRVSQPIEQARAALFLISDEASYITGISMPVDGGLVAT